jgi:hypothetical protein
MHALIFAPAFAPGNRCAWRTSPIRVPLGAITPNCVSTYPLFAASFVPDGTGTTGEALNVFTPVIVSALDLCTMSAVPSTLSTYCRVTNCAATCDGTTVARISPTFVGVAIGTVQYSVAVVPSLSL